MTRLRPPPRLADLDLSVSTWRARAVRYLLIYLALLLVLVGVRYRTQDIRPDLRAAQTLEGELTSERDRLSLDVQALESQQRLRQWAVQNGMRGFAQSPKSVQEIAPPAAPTSSPPSAPSRAVEVQIQWK